MRFHCQFACDYVINAAPADACRMLRDNATGKLLSSVEAKTYAVIMKAKGFDVLPLGCDNFDSKGRCNGHAE